MIRLIVRTDDANMAANVGGPVRITYQTFDIDLSALEALLTKGGLEPATLVGAEVIERPAPTTGGDNA